MKLHLGCGRVYRKGYVNVDAFDDRVADVAADLRLLPFQDRQASLIEAHHVIEHLGYVGTLFAVAEWYRLLQPGGSLILETPDPEASFRKFLQSSARQAKAECLNWIFGHETPGFQHKFLFPKDALVELLEKNGFSNVQLTAPRTHLYEPGLRVEGTKERSGAMDALSRLRRHILLGRRINLDDQVEVMEFEDAFIENARFCMSGAEASENDRKLRALAENMAISSRLALRWLELCRELEVPIHPDIAEAHSLASRLADTRFSERMIALTLETAAEEPPKRNWYRQLLEKATGLLRRSLLAADSELKVDMEQLFIYVSPPDRAEGESTTPGTALFLEPTISYVTQQWRDRGLKCLAAGELDAAEALLLRALNSGIDPLFSHWNLAILQACRANWEAAAERYREALSVTSRKPVTEKLRRELATCLRHGGREQEALAELSRTGSATTSFLATPRTTPALAGEGVYHQL